MLPVSMNIADINLVTGPMSGMYTGITCMKSNKNYLFTLYFMVPTFLNQTNGGLYNMFPPITKHVNFEATVKITLIILLALLSECVHHPCLHL